MKPHVHPVRQFIVKHFALDYMSKLFGKYRSAPRASRIIYPLMVVTGWFAVTNPDYPNPTLIIWMLYGLLATSLFLGFVYFRFYPVQWHELDDFQKYQYGGVKQETLSAEQFKEWLIILEKLKQQYPELY